MKTHKTIDDVAGWVDVLRAAQAEKSRAEAVIAKAREHIEDALGSAEIGLISGIPTVRWTTVTSTRFDAKKAKALLTDDDYAACTTETTTRRFTLIDPDDTP